MEAMASRLLLLLCVLLSFWMIAGQQLERVDSQAMEPIDLDDWNPSHSFLTSAPIIPDVDEHDMDKAEGYLETDKNAMSNSLSEEEEQHLMEILGGDLSKLREIKLKLKYFPRGGFPIEKDDEEMFHDMPFIFKMKLIRLKLKLKLLKMLDALCAAELGSRIYYRGKILHPRALERHFLESVLAHKILIKLLMSMKMRGDRSSPLALKLNEMKTKVGKALLLYAPNRLNTHVHLHADRAVVNVGTTLARTKANVEDKRTTLNTAAVQRPTLGDAIHDLRQRKGMPIRRCLHHLDGGLLCPRPGHRWHVQPVIPRTRRFEDMKQSAMEERPLETEAMLLHAPMLTEMGEDESNVEQDE